MPHTIHTNTCEGSGECVEVCPVEAITLIDIESDRNANGTRWARIDWDTCIDCGSCIAACPTPDAISDEVIEGVQREPA